MRFSFGGYFEHFFHSLSRTAGGCSRPSKALSTDNYLSNRSVIRLFSIARPNTTSQEIYQTLFSFYILMFVFLQPEAA